MNREEQHRLPCRRGTRKSLHFTCRCNVIHTGQLLPLAALYCQHFWSPQLGHSLTNQSPVTRSEMLPNSPKCPQCNSKKRYLYLLQLSCFCFKPYKWLRIFTFPLLVAIPEWSRKGIIVTTLLKLIHEYTARFRLYPSDQTVTVFSIDVCTTKANLESENKAIALLSIFKYEK